MTPERMKEIEDTKKHLEGKNINAVAQMLQATRDHNAKVQTEMHDLRRMVTQATQEITQLKGEIAALKMMGFKGNMGTGSTVHNKDE